MHQIRRASLYVVIFLLSTLGACCVSSDDAMGRVDLLAGSVHEYSTDGGESFTTDPPAIDPRETMTFRYRATFDLSGTVFSTAARLRSLVSLECDFGESSGLRWENLFLNGEEISTPFEDVRYNTVTAIDPHLLHEGENVLTVDLRIRNSSRDESLIFTPEISLATLVKGDLRFQTGPILGAFDDEFFTLACRTNMPAPVLVYQLDGTRPAGRRVTGAPVATSEEGLIHRFRITLDPSEEGMIFLVRAQLGGQVEDVMVRPPVSREDEFIFVAMGDSRSNTDDWRSVAAVVAETPAELVLFVGDMVLNGNVDRQWDNHFWGAGKPLLEKIPVYPVIGNHENDSPIFDALFTTPSEDGTARNWWQEKHGVLFVGIDGRQDWSDGSENARWLESVVSGSEAGFIFLITHYPPFSSAGHGSLDEDGRPEEKTVRECREVILPLLEKYHITALIAGHDHVYERSESSGGVTVIITGGAGAPRYKKSDDAEEQNPFSRVFESELHYSLFTVRGDTCVMEAVTPEGRIIDTRTWTARRTR